MTPTTESQLEQRWEEPAQEQELALADLDLPDKSAGAVTGGKLDRTAGGIRGGGCDDEFGCGSNHSEVLVVTA
jgi:hypothetical protein